jgi:multicomponent Na+:H+ antiporter subunit G
MELAGILLCAAGAVFFFAGTVGLIRFPDPYSRLHALTKADNLGLGFVVLGLALASQSWLVAGKLLLIWIITMLGGTTNCYLIGSTLFTRNRPPASDGGEA